MTSGDAGELRVQTLDGRVVRTTPIPDRLVQRPVRRGRVITASLDARDADGAEPAGSAARARPGRRFVPRRVLRAGLRLYGSLTGPRWIFRRRGEHDRDEARCFSFSCSQRCCVAAVPATADAKVPCRNKIYNDWYHDGKIASTYPLGCYRDALAHVRERRCDLHEPRGRHPRRAAGRDRAAARQEGRRAGRAQVLGAAGARRLARDLERRRAASRSRPPTRAPATRTTPHPRSRPTRRAARAALRCRCSSSVASRSRWSPPAASASRSAAAAAAAA